MTALYETLSTTQKLFLGHEALDVIHSGSKWNEGPAWLAASRQLVWSDIPNNRLMRFDELTGTVSVFREPSHNANGNTVDRQGRLITCEHGARRVTRTNFDGSVSVLADRFEGRRLNSPNDVVVRSDGTIWFSDPTYGIDTDYFGNRAAREQAGNYLYRLDPRNGDIEAVITDMHQPNGLAFSPDETCLYVVDSGRTSGADYPAHIRKFEVSADGGLKSLGVVVDCPVGMFDGIRVDADGRIWAGAGDGVYCFSSEGEMLGRIIIGEPAINLCFGGTKLNHLYICAPSKLYRVILRVSGINAFKDQPND
jgi:gluconolactonase